MHTTANLLMIRPVRFGYNAQTAVNNAFQVKSIQDDVQEKALQEFDAFVEKLRNKGIDVTVVNDTDEPHTPDSIFPNNWISFHDDGTIFLYPMFAENRRLERKPNVIQTIAEHFNIKKTIDLSGYEASEKYLEGTGSMVLDRDQKIAYACISPRTDINILHDFCRKADYQPIAFSSVDTNGKEIYHTNVMMCVGDQYVVICLASIPNEKEKQLVIDTIVASGKKLIDITQDQMNHFAGNMLQVQNKNGEHFLIMSSQAYRSLTAEQISLLQSYNPIIHSSLDTIESNGGGSARCMMAEVHLPKR
ncbi:arginine deiminase-related protein [soil metagenome]